MRNQNSFPVIIFFVILGIGIVWARMAFDASNVATSTIIMVSAFVVALLISIAIKIANPWERAVVLRWVVSNRSGGQGCFSLSPFWIPYHTGLIPG
jgi:hypothetical protein